MKVESLLLCGTAQQLLLSKSTNFYVWNQAATPYLKHL